MFHICSWDGISHWTWSSLFLLMTSVASKVQWLFCNSSPSPDLTSAYMASPSPLHRFGGYDFSSSCKHVYPWSRYLLSPSVTIFHSYMWKVNSIRWQKCVFINYFKITVETTGHLPGESTGVHPAREASASRSVGATLVPGLRGGRSVGESVEHRGQQLLERARATEPLRQRHFRLQTTGHLPGQSTGVCTAWEASASRSAGATLILGLRSRQSAGQSNTASGKDPVLGLHLRPGGGPNTR